MSEPTPEQREALRNELSDVLPEAGFPTLADDVTNAVLASPVVADMLAAAEARGRGRATNENDHYIAAITAQRDAALAQVAAVELVLAGSENDLRCADEIEEWWVRVREVRAALTDPGAVLAEHAPDVSIRGCRDMEDHARSYNEGYAAAIAHGLAPDGALEAGKAEEWLAKHDRRVRVEALGDAAAAIYNGAGDPEQEFYDHGVSPWLLARADREGGQ